MIIYTKRSPFHLPLHKEYNFPREATSTLSPFCHGAYDFPREAKSTAPPLALFRRKSVATKQRGRWGGSRFAWKVEFLLAGGRSRFV